MDLAWVNHAALLLEMPDLLAVNQALMALRLLLVAPEDQVIKVVVRMLRARVDQRVLVLNLVLQVLLVLSREVALGAPAVAEEVAVGLAELIQDVIMLVIQVVLEVLLVAAGEEVLEGGLVLQLAIILVKAVAVVPQGEL